MNQFRTDPSALSQPQFERLIKFFDGDDYKVLRDIACSRIAEYHAELGNNITASAEESLQCRELSAAGKNHVFAIARQQVFLSVLDEILAELKAKRAVIISDKIHIDPS